TVRADRPAREIGRGVQADSHRCAEPQRVERHVRRRVVRAAGDVLLRRDVRARDHLQYLSALAGARCVATIGRESRRVRLSNGIRSEPGPRALTYSVRSATIGSTVMARRAGTYDATSATTSIAIAAMTTGTIGFTGSTTGAST